VSPTTTSFSRNVIIQRDEKRTRECNNPWKKYALAPRKRNLASASITHLKRKAGTRSQHIECFHCDATIPAVPSPRPLQNCYYTEASRDCRSKTDALTTALTALEPHVRRSGPKQLTNTAHTFDRLLLEMSRKLFS